MAGEGAVQSLKIAGLVVDKDVPQRRFKPLSGSRVQPSRDGRGRQLRNVGIEICGHRQADAAGEFLVGAICPGLRVGRGQLHTAEVTQRHCDMNMIALRIAVARGEPWGSQFWQVHQPKLPQDNLGPNGAIRDTPAGQG